MAKNGHIIREGDVRFEADPVNKDYVLFQGTATRYAIVNGTEIRYECVNGVKRQWTKMKLKTGNIIADPFWFEKGAMKALRNARARLIGEDIKASIIALAKQKGKVKDVTDEPTKTKPVANEPKKTFAETMLEMLGKLGEEKFSEILGGYGFTTPDEIEDKDTQKAVYTAMKEALTTMAMSEVATADLEG
jgi:hypothetical protein